MLLACEKDANLQPNRGLIRLAWASDKCRGRLQVKNSIKTARAVTAVLKPDQFKFLFPQHLLE